LVGQAKATELETYIRLFDELPRKEEIIRDPKGTKLPSRADYMVPLSFSIVEWMNEENRDALITYLLRMGEDFQAMVFRTLKSTKIDLLLCNPQFTKWSIANQELLY
jgi:hypothetical protein